MWPCCLSSCSKPSDLSRWRGWGSVFYPGVLGTVVAFAGYCWLLARIRAVALALIAFITPIVAIFVGVILADESLSMA
ncbi:MAG: EamA family transporter, partial [candidate division Zixibacteria bacterium]|nr:EamA family transporter [candidate division Zixibacteria bacterium]